MKTFIDACDAALCAASESEADIQAVLDRQYAVARQVVANEALVSALDKMAKAMMKASELSAASKGKKYSRAQCKRDIRANLYQVFSVGFLAGQEMGKPARKGNVQ